MAVAVVLLAIGGAAATHLIWSGLAEEELYRAADSNWRQGRYGEAARLFERLLSRYPDGKLRARAVIDAANVYYFYLRNIHRATELYEMGLQELPPGTERLATRRHLAEIYFKEVGDLARALEEYRALREEEPGEKGRQAASLALGEIYFKRKEFPQALEEYGAAATSQADPHLRETASLRVGNILHLQRDHAAAEKPFLKVLGGSSCLECRHQAQLGLVDAYEAQEKFEAAIRVLKDMTEPEYQDFRNREIRRIEEKRGILHAKSAVNWADRRAKRP